MNISSSHIRYFLAVAQTSNISRAAERIGISQPSLSISLTKLENEIGEKLFVRNKNGVILTKAGQEFLKHGKELLEKFETIRSKAIASTNEVKGDYLIGCHESVALHFAGKFLADLLNVYPNLSISFRHNISRKITEDVISSRIDIGVVVNPIQHPDLVVIPLCKDEFTFYIPRTWEEEWKALLPQKKLILHPDLKHSEIFRKELDKKKMKFNGYIFSTDLDVIADLVANKAGFGLLPGRVAGRSKKPIIALSDFQAVQDQHCLIFRVENKNINALQVIKKFIQKNYK